MTLKKSTLVISAMLEQLVGCLKIDEEFFSSKKKTNSQIKSRFLFYPELDSWVVSMLWMRSKFAILSNVFTVSALDIVSFECADLQMKRKTEKFDVYIYAYILMEHFLRTTITKQSLNTKTIYPRARVNIAFSWWRIRKKTNLHSTLEPLLLRQRNCSNLQIRWIKIRMETKKKHIEFLNKDKKCRETDGIHFSNAARILKRIEKLNKMELNIKGPQW